MRDRISQLSKRLGRFFSVLYHTTQLIGALLTILVVCGLGSAILGVVKNLSLLLLFGIIVFIVAGLTLILLYTFVIEVIKEEDQDSSYPPPVASDDIGVVLMLKEIVYLYSPTEGNLCQRKRFKVRALRDGITAFADRYRWTGTGGCIIDSLIPGFQIVNQRKEEFWDYFDVQFPHALQRNDVADFTIEWTLIDEERTAVPFLSTMIDVDTEYLLMRVILPPALHPQHSYCYEFANYIDKLPISTQEVQWDPATQSINYEVSNPKKYHKYMIRWY